MSAWVHYYVCKMCSRKYEFGISEHFCSNSCRKVYRIRYNAGLYVNP